MHKEILLSIYIPTFNRPKELLELLSTIQIEKNKLKNKDLVEIVVSDNCSKEDLTQKLLSERLVDKISRNKCNLGPDKNVMMYNKKCNGEFVWLIGDDDLINEDSIVELVETLKGIKNQDIGFIYLNHSIENMDGSIIIEKVIDIDKHGVIDSFDLFDILNTNLLTMSNLVVRRRNDYKYSLNYGVGYFISPLTIALDSLELFPNSYFINKNMVRYREGDKSGWNKHWNMISLINIPYILSNFINTNKEKGITYNPYKIDNQNIFRIYLLIFNYKNYNKRFFCKTIYNYFLMKDFYVQSIKLFPYIIKKLFKKII